MLTISGRRRDIRSSTLQAEYLECMKISIAQVSKYMIAILDILAISERSKLRPNTCVLGDNSYTLKESKISGILASMSAITVSRVPISVYCLYADGLSIDHNVPLPSWHTIAKWT